MSSASHNPMHSPDTEFHGEIQYFSGSSLPVNDPQVLARVRRGRPGESEVRNYWVVGATDDLLDLFMRRGYWSPNEDASAEVKTRFLQIRPGDRMAVQRSVGADALDIEIRAIVVVAEVDDREWRIYVRWIATDLTRTVPLHGCAASIHGPFSENEEWTRQVFQL